MNRLTDTSPYSLWRGPVDLTSCDLEPVHRIGAVQSHGALLIFAADSGALLEASTNWREFLPTGSPSLEGLFSPSLVEQLLSLESSGRATLLSQTLPGEIEVSVLRLEDRLVIELESTRTALPFDPVAGLSTVMQALRGARSSEEYLRQLATELRRTLAIDHIMIYHFLPDWAGEVVAESSVDQVGYLGLRFPATDIPAPAREVFRQVWVRHIADVQAPAVPVQGEGARLTQLNLTQIGIRAASPVHLQYLANMNVRASLTLSLRLGDTLWGLVAGHHRSPYLLRPSARASLELVAQMASWQLSEHLQEGTRAQRRETEQRLSELEAQLEVDDDLQLASHLDPLQGLISCDTVAVYEDRRWTRKAGLSASGLDNLLAWVRREGSEAPLFHRNDLPPELLPGYAGVLALSSPEAAHGRAVLWLRREQSHAVRWAGNPEKSERWAEGRLNPRASFAEYVETTQGKSLPWSELDLWRAGRLAEVLRAVSLRQHRRLVQRNIALARSNSELDSFAYMASHDLKEPLRGIHNYATFLKEDYGHLLDADGLVFLDGLTSLSSRMTVLLDALLAYSRLNSQEIEACDCDLKALAEETVRLLKNTRQADIKLLEPLPVVQAYPPFLSEILVNLLTNAIKYSDSDRLVEIGALPSDEQYDTFFVRDNGIGIAPQYHQEIFRLFRRLHGEGERGDGSGVGLTIVDKMVKRHGGKVWVESTPGQGSTFYVSLPRLAHPTGAMSVDATQDRSHPALRA